MNYVVDSYENYKEENRLTTNNARRAGCVHDAGTGWCELYPSPGLERSL